MRTIVFRKRHRLWHLVFFMWTKVAFGFGKYNTMTAWTLWFPFLGVGICVDSAKALNFGWKFWITPGQFGPSRVFTIEGPWMRYENGGRKRFSWAIWNMSPTKECQRFDEKVLYVRV